MKDLFAFSWQMFAMAAALMVSVYFPGRLLLRGLRLDLTRLEQAVLALAAGSALEVVVYRMLYGLGWVDLWWGYGMLCTGVEIWLRLREYHPKIAYAPAPDETQPETWLQYWPLGLLVLGGIILQMRFMAGSGWPGPGGFSLLAWHAHDAPWHVFLSGQLAQRFPPEMPGFAGHALVNYHYFSDLFWGGLIRLGRANPWHVYFRFAPVWYAALLPLTVFLAAQAWSRKDRVAYLAVGLAAFSSTFGYVFPWLFGSRRYFLWDSIFWVQSPFLNIFNPGVSFSYPLLLAGVWALARWAREKEAGFLVLLGLCWGVLPSFKSYAGLVALGALVGGGGWLWLRTRSRLGLPPAAVVMAGFLVLFLPGHWQSSGLVHFLPGFNLAGMLVAPDRLGLLSSWELKRMMMQAPAAFAGLMGMALLVFILGNLGVRSLGLARMFQGLWNPGREDLVRVWMALAFLASLAGAVLFVQTGVQWNTIQFFYYGVILASLPAAAQIDQWLERFPRLGWSLIFPVCCLAGLPCTLQAVQRVDFWYRVDRPSFQALAWLAGNSSPRDVLLRPLSDALMGDEAAAQWRYSQVRGSMTSWADWKKDAAEAGKNKKPAGLPAGPAKAVSRKVSRALQDNDAAVAAGVTFRNTFLEDTTSAQIMGCPVEERVEAVRTFYRSSDAAEARKFLAKNRIRWVMLPRGKSFPFEPAGVPLKKEFGNEEWEVYKFVPGMVW